MEAEPECTELEPSSSQQPCPCSWHPEDVALWGSQAEEKATAAGRKRSWTSTGHVGMLRVDKWRLAGEHHP